MLHLAVSPLLLPFSPPLRPGAHRDRLQVRAGREGAVRDWRRVRHGPRSSQHAQGLVSRSPRRLSADGVRRGEDAAQVHTQHQLQRWVMRHRKKKKKLLVRCFVGCIDGKRLWDKMMTKKRITALTGQLSRQKTEIGYYRYNRTSCREIYELMDKPPVNSLGKTIISCCDSDKEISTALMFAHWI